MAMSYIYAPVGGDVLAVDTFFFFQAEDGIRDSSVTGVQTCALPISPDHLAAARARSPPERMVPERREEPEPEQRPGDLVRQEPGVDVDVRQRQERAGEHERAQRRSGQTEVMRHRDRDQRREQLHQRVTPADGLAALATLCAQQKPGDEGNVVVPGDGVLAARAAATRRDDALAAPHSRDP